MPQPKKAIKCLKLGETKWIYFDSLNSAARFLESERKMNISLKHYCANINQQLKGKCKYAYGYVWKLVSNNDILESKGE